MPICPICNDMLEIPYHDPDKLRTLYKPCPNCVGEAEQKIQPEQMGDYTLGFKITGGLGEEMHRRVKEHGEVVKSAVVVQHEDGFITIISPNGSDMETLFTEGARIAKGDVSNEEKDPHQGS